MADQLHPVMLRHLAIGLCLGSAVTGCGGSKQPTDQAATETPASPSGHTPSDAAHRARNERAMLQAYIAKGGRSGKPIPVIDARSVKPVNSVPASLYLDIPFDKPVIHRAEAGEPGADGWCVAESTRGSFSVSVPGRFSDSMIKSRGATGGTGVMHTIARKTADGTEFNVLETEVIGMRQQPHSELVQQMIVGYEKKGVTVHRKETLLAGVRADRLSLEARGVGGEIVLLSVADRNYMLGVQWRPPARAGLSDDTERFFASFAVKPKATNPAQP